MAQRTEKEETEYKAVPDTITLCLNNCGLTGNPATSNLCHNCFNATTASSSSPTAVATATPPHKFSAVAGAGGRSPRSASSRSPVRTSDPAETRRKEESSEAAVPAKREVNRCSGCRRKVGLTGFRCRCGDLFCADHRYSDRHDCVYDYKSAGREAIARENPVVKAAKIIRI